MKESKMGIRTWLARSPPIMSNGGCQMWCPWVAGPCDYTSRSVMDAAHLRAAVEGADGGVVDAVEPLDSLLHRACARCARHAGHLEDRHLFLLLGRPRRRLQIEEERVDYTGKQPEAWRHMNHVGGVGLRGGVEFAEEVAALEGVGKLELNQG
jgi:hypothetical protein